MMTTALKTIGTTTRRDENGAPLSWEALLHRATLSLTRQRTSGHRKADKGHDAHKGFAGWSRAVATPGTVAKGCATQQRAAYAACIDDAVVWDCIADTLLDRHSQRATELPPITDADLVQTSPSADTAQAVIGLSRSALHDRAIGRRELVTGRDPHRVTVTEFVLDTDTNTLTTAKVRKYARHHDAEVALGQTAAPDAAFVMLEQKEEVAACIAELPETLRVTALNALEGGGCPEGVPRNVYYKRTERMREALAAKFRARGLMRGER